MKHFLLYSLLFIMGCGDSNSAKDSPTATSTATDDKTEASPGTSQGDDIIGEWEMVGSVVDTNDNLLIDESERGNLKAPSFKDYMKFNSDGSGLFTVAKMEGRYEAKADGNGKRVLTWYDKGEGPHRIGTVVAVSREELHIKEPGGHGLFVWKRI